MERDMELGEAGAVESTSTDAPIGSEEQQTSAVTATETHNDAHSDEVTPRGAFTFVMLMLTFYVIYWLISWFEIFILRG